MGRRIVRFFLGMLYIVLLAALLITHTRQISGELERAMALAETLLLAVTAVAALVLYVRLKESGEKEKGSGRPAGCSPELSKYVGPVTLEQLREKVRALDQTPGEGDRCILTKRELEIAWLLCRGYSNRQIAEEYCIAETTVKKHTSHIYEKLQVSGRKELKEKLTK